MSSFITDIAANRRTAETIEPPAGTIIKLAFHAKTR